MKRCIIIAFLLCSLLFFTACGDQINLEKSNIVLLVGIDLDEKNKLTFFISSPTFDKDAKKKERNMKVNAKSLREARNLFDAKLQGTLMKGKVQTILIGKKFLQQKELLPFLDTLLRDPKDDLGSEIVIVDGAVEDIIYAKMEDKGRLSVFIQNMIESSTKSGITTSTDLQQFNSQLTDNRFTPILPMLKIVNSGPKITGLALLTHKGHYASSFNLNESALANTLMGKFNIGTIPLLLDVSQPNNKIHVPSDLKKVGINVVNVRKKVDTSIVDGHFQFDVKLTLFVDLTEKMFFLDTPANTNQLHSMIEEQLDKEYKKIIAKTQKYHIDPFAFGIQAKAKQYKHWKKVKNNWPDTYSKSKVNIKTNLIINNTGDTHA